MRICELLKKQSINLDATPMTKEDAINTLVDLMAKSDCLVDVDRFRAAVFDREAQDSTGLGAGVALPHGKSSGVLKPGLAAMIIRDGIDFDSLDGQPTKLFFMIASPHKASNAHLDVLARISTLMMSDEFRSSLLEAKDVDDFLSIIDAADQKEIEREEKRRIERQKAEEAKKNSEHSAAESNKGYYDIVAVTACPAGLSHTYMAAEALEKKAKEMGVKIKIETDGAAGNRNRLLPEEISKAKAVIVAADRIVEMERFHGKRVIRVGVVDGIRKPEELIKAALSPKIQSYQANFSSSFSLGMRLYRHLMSGMTYIMPVLATAGILSALSKLDLMHGTTMAFFFEKIGYSIGTLIFPILSAFIAFSIRGRTALVAGFTGGVMADLGGCGVVGAVVNGFVGGGVAMVTSMLVNRFLRGHDAIVALILYPLIGALATAAIVQAFTSIPTRIIDEYANALINEGSMALLIALGAVLAGMMASDMGGPINKTSYAIGVLLLADCLPDITAGGLVMASIMAGGMVPSLAASIANYLVPQAFSESLKKERFKTFGKGLVFITEGVIPYLQADHAKMRVACILSSALTGGLSMYFGCTVCAPHGGIFIIPLSSHPLEYVCSILAGTLCGMFLFSIIHLNCSKKQKA